MATYPETDVNKTQPRLKSDDTNPLHSFATYNCLFTLSGINEAELQSQRRLISMPSTRDVIARSAGIGGTFENSKGIIGTAVKDDVNDTETVKNLGRSQTPEDYKGSVNILERGHDIFFENVNITSTVGPNTDRNLANFTKMEFELHEPYSVTFIEKIRAAAFNNGYEDYQAAPFLLTIEWKGFNENGRPLADKTKSLVRKVPIFITRVEFDVDEGGARYNVVAVPYSEMAFDDSYKYPRTIKAVNVNNIEEWIEDVKQGLNVDQMEQEIDEGVREFADEYDFDISQIKPFIGNGNTMTKEKESIFNTATVEKSNEIVGPDDDLLAQNQAQIKSKEKGMNIDMNTNVVKAFEDMIRSLGYYQELLTNFWKTYTGGELPTKEEINSPDFKSKALAKTQYVDWFYIKPKIENIRSKGIDKITKMYPKKITYQAIPYKVHVLKLITPGISFGEVDWEKYARRKYNYIYTGDNIDVQNLRINYKTAYYYRNVRKDAKADAGEDGKITGLIVDNLKKLFGAEKKPPEPTLPLRQYPSVLKQRSLVQEINPKSHKAQEFFDYLTNPEADMIGLEMEILGDPAYVAQDIFAPIEDRVIMKGDFDPNIQSFNMQTYMPIVHLRYRMPADIDDVRGKMFTDKYLDDNLFFSGAYQVTKVESQMNQGEFKQTLTMVRLNNQTGEGAPPTLVKAVNDQLTEAIDSDTIERKVKEKVTKEFKRGG